MYSTATEDSSARQSAVALQHTQPILPDLHPGMGAPTPPHPGGWERGFRALRRSHHTCNTYSCATVTAAAAAAVAAAAAAAVVAAFRCPAMVLWLAPTLLPATPATPA
jgi:hypothetical protein